MRGLGCLKCRFSTAKAISKPEVFVEGKNILKQLTDSSPSLSGHQQLFLKSPYGLGNGPAFRELQ